MGSSEAIESQVRGVLERFNELVSTRSPQVLAEFALGEDVLLIGSEAGEAAKGSQEITEFFARIFERDATFSWEWDRIEASHTGSLAWFFAEGRVVVAAGEQRKSPYRVSGVLERRGGRWLWRQYHGSEPVSDE
jgi:ketosteroid isomerase-like protein